MLHLLSDLHQMLTINRQKHAYIVLLYRSFHVHVSNVCVEQTDTYKDNKSTSANHAAHLKLVHIKKEETWQISSLWQIMMCMKTIPACASCRKLSRVLTHIITPSSHYILTCPMMLYRLCAAYKHVSDDTKNQREPLSFNTKPILTP